MLTHLIILLDDTSVSYCHYRSSKDHRLIDLDDLKTGIVWAMKENLNIQFVYSDDELPDAYLEAIDSIDHVDIRSASHSDKADVVVLEGWDDEVPEGATCIVHSSIDRLAKQIETVGMWLSRVTRLNVVLTDVETFKDEDIESYKTTLISLVDELVEQYINGRFPQLNLVTDRIMLNEMNNCNAGVNSITLAPNGKFYLCPAFYYENERQSVGDLKHGLDIKNQHLLKLEYAPICRECDAYHCKRCIWLNGLLTLDNNTPSHQQCVIAHLERNASRLLQQKLSEKNIRLTPSYEIKEIKYLDPFNIVNKWN